MEFVIGTTNIKKLRTANCIINQILGNEQISLKGTEVESGVPYTPFGSDTLQGSRNRAGHCKTAVPNADYWIGLESGLVERYGETFEEAWACIFGADGKEYLGYSSGLKVPFHVLSKMKMDQKEHWQVMNGLRKQTDHSHDTWGDYSARMISREVSFEEALRNALIQAFAPEESYYRLG